LCGYTGIENETIENQAAYIEHWRKQLAADKKLVISAASQTQKAKLGVPHPTGYRFLVIPDA
jgi:antirestriction protein ArdC